MTVYGPLMGRIEGSLADLGHVVRRVEALAAKADLTGDDDYLDGVALNLHGFYTGAERIFEDIAREVEEGVPASPDWHRQLLLQMSVTINGLRPAVLTSETRRCLDEYRAFRHVVRNIYAFELWPSRLRELAQGIGACYGALIHDLNVFVEFLSVLDPHS